MKLNTFDSVYKFPEIDVVNQNNKIEFDERILKSKQKKQKIYGSTNFKIDQQYIDQHSNSMIKSKIKSLNYEHMTINELKIYLYADMYNMIQELYYVNKLDLNQINQILAGINHLAARLQPLFKIPDRLSYVQEQLQLLDVRLSKIEKLLQQQITNSNKK